MSRTAILTAATLYIGLFAVQAPAQAQEQDVLTACSSQQELEQVMSSNGSIVPDGCRAATVSSLTSNGEQLCLLDLSSSQDGVLDQLREAAVSQQWWVRCEDLLAASN